MSEPAGPGGADPGLCRDCCHGRAQGTARGSTFWRCGRAERDAAWPRYPQLPVLRCDGFEERRSAADPEPTAGR